MSLRLGRISYANMAPVFYELEGAGLEQISGETERMSRLVGELLTLARADTGRGSASVRSK